MTSTDARAPASRAASATPCAALPALTVQTPSASSARRQLRDRVHRAADLERSDRLEDLEFQEDLGRVAADRVEPDERRARGDR